MKPAKQFDCVQMKWEIQQRLVKEFGHLPPEEARAEQRKRIEEDSEFTEFLKRVQQGAPIRPRRR